MPQNNNIKDQKHASDLLANPMLHDICEQLDTQYYQRWCDELDPAKREMIWNKANGIREVLGLIKHMAQGEIDGEAA